LLVTVAGLWRFCAGWSERVGLSEEEDLSEVFAIVVFALSLSVEEVLGGVSACELDFEVLAGAGAGELVGVGALPLACKGRPMQPNTKHKLYK